MPLHFFGSTSRIVLVSAFVVVGTFLSVSCLLFFYSWCLPVPSGVNPAGDRGGTSPQMSDGEGTVMHHVPPNMAEISLHKRQSIRLYLLNYVIVLFLSNISCLQLCQMFYRGQLCELYFQSLDHKHSRRPPKFPIRFTPLPVPSHLHKWGGRARAHLCSMESAPLVAGDGC